MEQLGIDPRLILAQIVNFGIILFLLTRILYKPILTFLAKRKKEIADGVAMAENMKLEEKKMAEKQEKLLADARKQAKAMIDDAKKTAKEEVAVMMEKAQKQASQLMDKTKAEAAAMKKDLEKSVRKEALAEAEEKILRALPKTWDLKEQRALIAKQLKELNA